MSLKRCPVCGGEAFIISREYNGYVDMSVKCQKCGDSVGVITLPEFEQKMEDTLAKAWNMHEHSFKLYSEVSEMLHNQLQTVEFSKKPV